MGHMKWNKSELRIVVFSLSDHANRNDSLMSELAESGNKAHHSSIFREELADAKELFRGESKRVQKEEKTLSREMRAFYSPALRQAAARFPALNRPSEWLDGLYNVQIDLDHHLSSAKQLLNELERLESPTNA